MPSYGIAVYVSDEDVSIYVVSKALLNDKAREAFDKELSRIKESISKAQVSPFIPSEIEEGQGEAVHEKMARKRKESAQDRLYGVDMRRKKGEEAKR